MDSIAIKEGLLKDLEAHAIEEFPNEACGLLAGTGAAVTRLYRIRNVDASPVTYGLDPAEQIAAMREIREAGLELMAIYHSHPGSPAVPSTTDVNRAFFPGTRDENYPGCAYVIAGVSQGAVTELRAFNITTRGVEDVGIELL